jgi:TonB family protein
MSALANHEAGVVSGRTSILLITAALHAVLIAGLLTTRMNANPDRGPDAIKSWIDLESAPRTSVPRVERIEPRQWSPTQAHVPTPPVDLELPPAPDSIPVQTAPLDPGTTGAMDTVPSEIPSTPLGYSAAGSTDDFYPPASIRNNETGLVVVNVCVSAQGRVVERPRISTSSGYSRLDGAAIKWFMEGARFTPATRNGEPVADCRNLRVNFTLKGN